MRNKLVYTIFIFIILLLSSCSVSKHVPYDKYLLNRVKINSDVKNQTEIELKQYLKQVPNTRSFGIYRLQLNIYNLSGSDTTKKVNRFLRKIGDAPVLYDEALTERSCLELKKYLQNKGYVNASVESNVEYKKRKVNVTYNVYGNRPYRIQDYKLDINNDTILNIIKNDSANSLIHKNMLFDTDILNNERQKLTNLLKRKGYLYFNKDYLHYVVDSTLTSNKIDVTLSLRPAVKTESDGSLTTSSHKQYTVRKIVFFTSFDPLSPINISSLDSLKQDNYTFYFNKKINIRPNVLISSCYVEANSLYNEQQVEKTYTALNLLSAFKYVNIRFKEVEGELNTMDCIISTSPSKLQSYSIDVEGTNSTGDFGFAGILSYKHKNIFKGAEILKLSVRMAHETESGTLSDLLKNNANDIGAEASLTFPSFLFPFLNYDFRHQIHATTELSLNYDYEERPEYDRTIITAGLKYNWFLTKTERQTFDLIDVSYVYLPSISEAFRKAYLNDSSILKYSYENQLIVRSLYSLSIGNRTIKQQHDNVIFRLDLESAGNCLYALSKLLNEPMTNNSYTIGNITFAQYLKSDFDFSYNKYINKRNNFVSHIAFGLAYPYGNTDILPFEKRYIGGGADGVRGWEARTLGPGVYTGSDQIDYMSQSGDINLVMNLEYRFKMFWVMEGALFTDAGNIWTIRNYDSQPGGQFLFNQFYKQIAGSYGFGTRFDFTYFLIRIDLGVKAYNPALEGSQCWRFNKTNWNDDFALHFAVGYPF